MQPKLRISIEFSNLIFPLSHEIFCFCRIDDTLVRKGAVHDLLASADILVFGRTLELAWNIRIRLARLWGASRYSDDLQTCLVNDSNMPFRGRAR